jgi:hypothetical protein
MSYVESTVDLGADVIDVRDIISRVQELRDERDSEEELPDDDAAELDMLEGILSELAGCGGDEEFDGDWYPVTLVCAEYFQEYAQNLAEECGLVDTSTSWPMNCIDWEQAARELQMDYSHILIHGFTYWYR